MTDEFIDDLLLSFEIHLQSRGRYPRTIESYLVPTRRLYEWLPEKGEACLKAVTRKDLELYVARGLKSVRGEELSPASRAYHFKGLQQFWKWYSDLEGIADPMARMRAPLVPEVQKDIVSVDQVRGVAAHLDQKKLYRDAALISLLMEDGMRVSEAINLRWCDINLREREATVTWTKNHEVRVVPYGAQTAKRLDVLHRKRADKQIPWVFVKANGEPLSRFAAYSTVRRRFALFGMDGISPHDLRHSMATAFMDANPDGEATLMVVGGWKSRTMVERYSKKGKDRRAIEDFRKRSPTGRL